MKQTRNEVKRLTADARTKLIIDGLWRDFVMLRDESLLAPGDRDKTDTEDEAYDPRYVFAQNLYRAAGDLLHSWATGHGFGHTINADFAQVHGFGNVANSMFETIFGPYCTPGADQSAKAWVDTDLLYIFGNGTGEGENPNSNALEIFKSGLFKLFNAIIIGAYSHGAIDPVDGAFQFNVDHFEGWYNNKWNDIADHLPVTLDPTSNPALSVNELAQTIKLDLSGWDPAPTTLNQCSGFTSVGPGKPRVVFPTPLDESITEVIVMAYCRRDADNAVVDFVIENEDYTGFDCVVWEDLCYVKYIAMAKGFGDMGAYATVAYVDGLIGDIQTILESI